MNIFVTLDRNYLSPLRVMLGSLLINNPGEDFAIYLAADGVLPEDVQPLCALSVQGSLRFHFLQIDEKWFENAPTVRYYSRAMYYRLLAAQLLPQDIDRALYLDPDILVIGRVRELYETPLNDRLYAAAMHRGFTGMSGPISKLRLPDYEADDYFNSGVLLMNLPRIRETVRPEDIFAYVEKNHQALILPDQDVLNGLYGTRILPQEEAVWNYDVRRFDTYRIASQGRMDMDWVMHNTVFLHFCGKKKPWNPSFKGRFNALYKHYRALVERYCEFE